MNYNKQVLGFILLSFSLFGCVSSQHSGLVQDEMETFILCQHSPEREAIEKKIYAEYGYKRFTENAYKPVIEKRLFGHEIRVVEMCDGYNKVYASGEPLEFAYNLKKFFPELSCNKGSCSVTMDNNQTLSIYKSSARKSKDTTVIMCTKASLEEGSLTN